MIEIISNAVVTSLASMYIFLNADVLSGITFIYTNPLSPELNPICYLLALLAHNFLHVSRIRVKFNVYGSVHRKYILLYIQQDARLHILFISGNCSTCFGCAHSNQFQLFHDSGR
jgi:hypothetical protein